MLVFHLFISDDATLLNCWKFLIASLYQVDARETYSMACLHNFVRARYGKNRRKMLQWITSSQIRN